VLVTDFGIAKAAEAASGSQLTTEGMVVGTPQYMSPEQATGEKIGTRSDIYSLGIVLYQMLAGSVPFDGESVQSILMKQATGEPAPIRSLRPSISAELAAVVHRTLAKDPGERFATAAELDAALMEVVPVRSSGPADAPPGLLQSAVKSFKSASLGALVVSAALVTWMMLDHPPKIDLRAPVPDSLNSALRRRGILAQDDTAVFAFSPGGEQDVELFVIAQRRVVVVAPRRLRGYPRSSVAFSIAPVWRAGPKFAFILLPTGTRPDTVFERLSPRGVWSIARGVEKLLPGGVRLLPSRAGGS